MLRQWKIGIVYDTLIKTKGHHGTHLAFTGLPDVELIVADPNSDGIAQRMEEIGAEKHYLDYKQMIVDEKPDIIVICSRLPDGHFEVIKTAIDHGCHVLCEKPLTAVLSEGYELAQAAKTKGVKIAVAHLARYALVFRTLKSMIDAGEIGQPLTFYGRGKEDDRGGGEDLIVLGTHILDIAVFLFGWPEYVFADVRNDDSRITATDRTETTEPVGICAGNSIWSSFKFTGGVNGVFESRHDLFEGTMRMGVTVVGTKGTLSVRYDPLRELRICRSAAPPEDESSYEVVALHEERQLPPGSSQFDYEHYQPLLPPYFLDSNRFVALDLMQAIAEDRKPVCDINDALISLEMIYAIYASSLEGRAIELPLTNRDHPLGD